MPWEPKLRRPMRRIRDTLVLVLVLVAAASGCGSRDRNSTGEKAEYVALGDSYTSGAGIYPLADNTCARSAVDYPSLLATALEVASFADQSCGGATTDDFENAQMSNSLRVNEPQLDAVTKRTTLVTVGIGLNDGLISTGLLFLCVTPVGTAPNAPCTTYLSYPENIIEAQLTAAASQVEHALEAIALKAPRATIVLVGYPRLVPDEGSCPSRLPVPEAQVDRMRDAMAFADEAWRQAAEKAGAVYVDMYGPSEGHDICSADPWISDYQGVSGRSLLLHPFESYHKAVAARILRVLKGD